MALLATAGCSQPLEAPAVAGTVAQPLVVSAPIAGATLGYALAACPDRSVMASADGVGQVWEVTVERGPEVRAAVTTTGFLKAPAADLGGALACGQDLRVVSTRQMMPAAGALVEIRLCGSRSADGGSVCAGALTRGGPVQVASGLDGGASRALVAVAAGNQVPSVGVALLDPGGSRSWQSRPLNIDYSIPPGLAAGDLTADGVDELVVALNSGVFVFVGVADGGFDDSPVFFDNLDSFASGDPLLVALGRPVPGAGGAQITVAARESRPIVVYELGRSSGGTSTSAWSLRLAASVPPVHGGSERYAALVVGDWTGDGLPEIMVGVPDLSRVERYAWRVHADGGSGLGRLPALTPCSLPEAPVFCTSDGFGSGSLFGSSLAVVPGDSMGGPRLLIGSPNWPTPANASSGVVHVLGTPRARGDAGIVDAGEVHRRPPSFETEPPSVVCGESWRYEPNAGEGVRWSLEGGLPESIAFDELSGTLAWAPAAPVSAVEFVLVAANDAGTTGQRIRLVRDCSVAFHFVAEPPCSGCNGPAGSPSFVLGLASGFAIALRGRGRRPRD